MEIIILIITHITLFVFGVTVGSRATKKTIERELIAMVDEMKSRKRK